MTDELTFSRWALLRDYIEIKVSLRREMIQSFIRDGYLTRTETAVELTDKGRDALKHEPAV